MKIESKGIELNIVKGVIGINNVPISSRNIIKGLELLSSYNSYIKYNIDKINFVYPFGGIMACGMNKNGKEIKLTQRKMKIWKIKMKE